MQALAQLPAFMDMGKNSIYIWSAWLITIGTILLFILLSTHTRKKFYRQQLSVLNRQKKAH